MENRYGIEIELENCRRLDRFGFPSYWTVEGDGSLRNAGMEFKSSRDYGLNDAKSSLTHLHNFLEGNGIEPEVNPRCGVHVHMDVRDMSHEQVYNLLCNYSMIEPTFFAYVNNYGEDREGSHFCVPYYHLRDRAAALMMAFKEYNIDNIQHFGRKYMALNVLPYLRFGSVEWRQFPSILPVTGISEWLDILDKFKERSKLGVFSEDEVLPWLDEVLPNLSSEDRLDVGLETYYYHTLPLREESSIVRPTLNRTMIDDIFGEAAPARMHTIEPRPEEEVLDLFDMDEEEPEDTDDEVAALTMPDMDLVNEIPEELRVFALNHDQMELLRHPIWRAITFDHKIHLLRWVELNNHN